MLDDNLTTIVVAGITVLSGAGFWSWMQKKSELAYAKSERDDRDNIEFRDTLKAQLDDLRADNVKLHERIEQLLNETADLKAELASAKATITHLEAMLRMRGIN